MKIRRLLLLSLGILVLFLLFCVLAPLFVFRSSHVAIVSCPVTKAYSVISKEDGATTVMRFRFVEVRCDYATAGAPPAEVNDETYRHEGGTRSFDEDANASFITKGDRFICTTEWATFSSPYMPESLNIWATTPNSLKGCHLFKPKT
ncbi:MAG: hypothetical protein WAV50_00975 [Minisyncoccia bacterium]